jgi:serine-type D-Ala-D-Ala carboxypeptidase (penicillin-binding protein 5/6)
VRRRALIGALAVLAAGCVGGAVGAALLEPWEEHTDATAPSPATAHASSEPARARSPFALRPAAEPPPVQVEFNRAPRAGILFDVDTGEVLWERHPRRELPIASLTKMMTALLIAERHRPSERVQITPEALAYEGSGVGVLPKGKQVKLETMLNGLLLVSGNDAAIALAQRAAGTVPKFVRLMNRKARSLGLTCTRFSSPHGYKNRGNHSCAADLAAIGRAVLRSPRLARIVKRRQAVLPFPIKGRKIFLYNNNPLLRTGYTGTTGVKTGFTDAAGLCLVASARRGRVRLGVVLLHSVNPGDQARKLLDRGFAFARRSAG